jgi:phosphomethylpyrimidine synthase
MIRYAIKNKERNIKPLFVGNGEPTRIVANIGITPKVTNVNTEFKKASAAVKAGSDIISDLSIDREYRVLLSKLVNQTDVPIATVPLYGVCINAMKNKGTFVDFKPEDIMEEIEYQGQLGIDIITIHATLTKDILIELKESERSIKIPSRGGSFIAAYMIKNGQENPFYEYYNNILTIAKKYDITISVGTALRPGSITDGIDKFYLHDIAIQMDLVERAIKKGVKVMVESIGHLSADMIPTEVKLHKNLCHGVPLRPLPICTDRAAGYDHIAGSIAAALCALNGADILSVITRGEHLGLPRIEDIVEGVKSFKIAAHIADIVKLKKLEDEQKISEGRNMKKWEEIFKHALYPGDAKKLHETLSQSIYSEESCSMCGSLCALRIVNTYLKKEVV